MRQNSLFMLFALAALVLSTCVKPYEPVIESSDTDKYVVMGQVTDQEGFQQVSISKTAPLGEPAWIPVTGCSVTIADDEGHSFSLSEEVPGVYRSWFAGGTFLPGRSYQLIIRTADGEEIISGKDMMPDCPEVDSVYYERDEIPTSDPNESIPGFQFYVDYNSAGTSSRFVRWDLVETWEYHTQYPIEFYYDGQINQVIPPDFSKNVCWQTRTVDKIFTLSTQSLSGSIYRRLSLHFVDNTTPRLSYGYSLLVRQLSLSGEAFAWWDKMRLNSSNTDAMYQQQPMSIKGNLINNTRPEKEVLGFFSASSVRMKRIFVTPPADLEMNYYNFCGGPVKLERGWSDIAPFEYPCYFIYIYGGIYILDQTCVDCLAMGGTNVKPVFWPVK